MKIGIYARGLSGLGGVKQYIEAMTRETIGLLDGSDELYIFHNLPKPYFSTNNPNVFEVILESRNKLICDHLLGPRAIRERDIDITWFTKYVVPLQITGRTITTIHDMAYYFPDLGAYSLSDTIYMRTMIRNSCRRADGIVAVSKNSRNDIVRLLDVDPAKVHVIHEAADEKYERVTDVQKIARFRKKYALPDKYILFTGGISPRKNLLRLIEAFHLLAPRLEHKLVLTGAKGWKNKEVMRAIAKSERIVRLGFVDDVDMPLLYSAADVFVYPSLYEGFGLPVLEAGACGCPVLASQTSSIPEVGSDAVLYVDPLDTKEIASGMERLLTDKILADDHRKRGLANAKRFSWKKAAAELMNLMRTF